MDSAGNSNKVYHISPLRQWIVPGIFLAFAIFLLTLSLSDDGTPATRKLGMFMALGSVGFALVMLLIMRRTRLECSDDGIKLHQFGYKLETDWNNIAYLQDGPGPQGLVLHRPMECAGARTLAAHRHANINNINFYSDDQIQLLAEHRFIPIDAFAHSLTKGPLGDDLRRRTTGKAL